MTRRVLAVDSQSAPDRTGVCLDEPGGVPAGLVRPPRAGSRSQPLAVGILLRASIPALVVVLWILASADTWFPPAKLAPIGSVWHAFVHLANSGMLASNFFASFKRAMLGLLVGAAVGVPVAFAAGLSRLGDQILDTPMQMLRTIPFLAVAPLTTVWLGIGQSEKVVMIAWACAIPFYINTHAGVRRVDKKLIEAARVYGASRSELIRTVILPGALPQILVGLRYAIGLSLLALIFVEQTNATLGIGALMNSATELFQTNVIVVLILLYAAWGLAGDLLVRALEWALMPWDR